MPEARLSSRWTSPPPGKDAAVGQKPCRCRMPDHSCEIACSRAARCCALAPHAAWARAPYPPFRMPVCCPAAPPFPVASQRSSPPRHQVSGPQGPACPFLQSLLSGWLPSAARRSPCIETGKRSLRRQSIRSAHNSRQALKVPRERRPDSLEPLSGEALRCSSPRAGRDTARRPGRTEQRMCTS